MTRTNKSRRLGLFNRKECARIVGVEYNHFLWLIKAGQVPQPTHCLRGNVLALYDRNDVEGIRALIDLIDKRDTLPPPPVETRPRYCHAMPGFYNRTQAAVALGIHHATLLNYIKQGVLSAPTHMVGRRTKAVYSKADIEAIRQLLARGQQQARPTYKAQTPDGFVRRTHLEERLGLSDTTFRHHIKMGHIPLQTHKRFGYVELFYTDEEAQTIIDFFTRSRVPDGYKCVNDMAQLFGVTPQTLRYWADCGWIVRATHTFAGEGHKRFWSPQEVETITNFVVENQNPTGQEQVSPRGHRLLM